mmetsp:Transcript_36525/g.35348  ORF Transcript_36525/g.35348 Transcript_36525/m.35348 type:complete len:118 (+) Transcript_36525:101-454(+)
MNRIDWKLIERSFRHLHQIKHMSNDSEMRNKGLRRTLAEGFFMNAARRISNLEDGKYLTVNESSLAQVDKNANMSLRSYFPDWICFTEISESGKKGLIRMCFEIKLKWIQDQLPRLK